MRATPPIWSIAGLDPGILARAGMKWRRKYRRGSINLFLIALMCAVSGGFTFWIIFESILIAIPFSVLWTTILVNLYRLVLLTVGNPHIPHSPKYKFPFGSFLFRSVFLLVLGLFIIKPLELLILQQPLQPHLEAHRAEVLSEHQERMTAFDPDGSLDVFQSQGDALTRTRQGGFLMTRITLLHEHFPNTWILTVVFLWIFMRPFWSRIRWRKRSTYEVERGKIEFEVIDQAYAEFVERYGTVMEQVTGRDDIWEEPYRDMPYKNDPIILEKIECLHPGSIYAWGRIFAKENSDEEADVTDVERHIYLVGDLKAKYYGTRVRGNEALSDSDYALKWYDLEVFNAAYVEDPELPESSETNYLSADNLNNVVIYFNDDPTGYDKPFREELRDPIVGGIRLEGVVKERKRTYGTVRGRLYCKVYTTVMPRKV